MRTGKGEPAVLRFLRTGIARTSLNILKTNIDTLTQCKKIKFFWGRTISGRYHKTMIPTQHWCKPPWPFFETFGGARLHKVEFASQEVKGSLVLLWAVRLFST